MQLSAGDPVCLKRKLNLYFFLFLVITFASYIISSLKGNPKDARGLFTLDSTLHNLDEKNWVPARQRNIYKIWRDPSLPRPYVNRDDTLLSITPFRHPYHPSSQNII